MIMSTHQKERQFSTHWLKSVIFGLSLALSLEGFNVNRAEAQVSLGDLNFTGKIQSSEFERLCAQLQPLECQNIGKAAHISTTLIYKLFDAETQKTAQKTEVISQITQLYNADQISTINKRLSLPEIFRAWNPKAFGGYVALIRSRPVQQLYGSTKITYVIAFKGTSPRIEDPNDFFAGFNVPTNFLGIHEGIKNYADAVFQDAKSQAMLAEILKWQSDRNTDLEIILTGHSLGVATFFYAAMLKEAGVSPVNMKIIVFGSPLFAEASFANKYQDLARRMIRIEAEGDILRGESDSPVKIAYDLLRFVGVGRLILAGTTSNLPSLNSQRVSFEQRLKASPSPDLLTAYLQVQKQIFEEKLAIHLYGYRYFYEYYLATASSGQ